MGKIRNSYSPEEKVKIVFEGLTYPDGISKYCRSKGISDVLFYKWKHQIENNAKQVFLSNQKESKSELELRSELIRKDTIISELVSENLTLKKKNRI